MTPRALERVRAALLNAGLHGRFWLTREGDTLRVTLRGEDDGRIRRALARGGWTVREDGKGLTVSGGA